MRELLTMLRARLRASDDTGFAMVTVLGIGTVMTGLMLASLAYAMQVMPQARRDQDWNAALAAAQAGVDDYVSRLNKNDSYSLVVDCANVALKGPATAPSCGYVASTAPGWVDVKPAAPTKGQFHYDPMYAQGNVHLLSTGRVGTAYRTVDVRIGRGGSTDFLYYTDFEDADPENMVVYPNGTSTNCGGAGSASGKYWWQPASGSTLPSTSSTYNHRSGCTEIAFAGNDKLDGRAHFNDTPGIAGGTSGGQGYQSVFTEGYETADPNCPLAVTANPTRGRCWRYYPYPGNSTSAGKPYFPTGRGTQYANKLDLPDNSTEFINYPGCVYYGDTRIRFNSNGTMTVWNTGSSAMAIVNPVSPAGTNCGVATSFAPTSANDPRPSSGQTVPVPTDMVIYVRGTGSTDPCVPGQIVNGSASGSASTDVIPQGSGVNAADVRDITYFNPDSASGNVTRTFTKPGASTSTNSWVGGSSTQGATSTGDGHSTKMDCGQGNVYVEGTVKGRVTIAAENNLIVTSNLLLSSTAAGSAAVGTDMIGLVSGNSVGIYHPVSRNRSNPSNTVSSSENKVSCDTVANGIPDNAPKNVTTVTCTWKTSYTYGSSYSDLGFAGQTGSNGTRWLYASIQTLQHSMLVFNYDSGGDLGTLGIRGSIAQRYRGIVRQGSAGFDKDYGYDSRLQYLAPPYFPQWTNSSWSAQTSGELKPAYVGK